MKLCPNCGTQNADHFTQCPNCGAMLPAGTPQPVYSGTSGYIPPAYQDSPVTSMGGWFCWSLLCVLLIIGPIIMICAAKDPSAKNYGKAALILQVIGLVICFLFGAVMIATVRSLAGLS